MDFIAGGLVEMIGGLASAAVLARLRVVGAARCSAAPGWRRTGCCARAASGATATPTRCARAQRDADYAYRLAVDPPASKELRLFGLADWTIDRFVGAPHAAARSCSTSDAPARAAGASGVCCSSSRPTSLVFWSLATRPRRTAASVSAKLVVFAQSAIGASMIAFGGLNWALDGAAAPVAAVLRLEPAMAPAGALPLRQRRRGRDAGAGDPIPRS